jgi:3-oxoadipate enol-lactonase
MPEITVDGLRLHWEEHNPGEASGLPVVLLHGLGSRGDDWLLQTPVLGLRRRVLTPDLPGHGKSAGFRGWPAIQAYADAVRKMLERAGAAPAHLLGLSLGGAVAIQLALDSPTHVVSLVPVNTLPASGRA